MRLVICSCYFQEKGAKKSMAMSMHDGGRQLRQQHESRHQPRTSHDHGMQANNSMQANMHANNNMLGEHETVSVKVLAM